MTDEIQNYINTVYNSSHLNPQKKLLLDSGYNRYVVRQGCLLDDELWIHQESIQAIAEGTHNPLYIFVFKEKYVNDWSSTQTMRRYKKLPKKYYKFVMLG